MGFEVDEEEVADYGGYLAEEAYRTLPKIETLAREEGMSDVGFTGALSPLGEVVNGEANTAIGAAFDLMQRKLCDLGDAVVSAAEDYGYMDDREAGFFESSALSDGDAENIDFGEASDRYSADGSGSSNFPITELSEQEVDRPDESLKESIDTGGVWDVLDWIWAQFPETGDGDFTDMVLEPLSGNFPSIAANGDAWRGVGTQFGELAGTMGTNASTLAANHWDGEAAQAFKGFLDEYWKDGATWAGEQLGNFVGQAFDKCAEVCKEIAELAVELIEKGIVKIAKKIGTKLIPYLGQAWAAVEYILRALGVDVDTLHEQIMQIISIAQTVYGLYDSIENIVESMGEVVNTVEELQSVVAKIPEINNLSDAQHVYNEIDQGLSDLNDQRESLQEELDSAQESVDEFDEIEQSARENKQDALDEAPWNDYDSIEEYEEEEDVDVVAPGAPGETYPPEGTVA